MRDLKFLPESQRGLFRIRHKCRKLIHERITALLGEAFFSSDMKLLIDV